MSREIIGPKGANMSNDQMTERVLKRQEVILKAVQGEINWIQAADICGITARHMRRLKLKYEARGYPTLIDNRFGRLAWNHVPLADTKKVLSLYREEYFDFNVQHFKEKLKEEHQINRSYSWVKKILQDAGLVSKEKKRKKHRRRRERKPLVGMMLHLDGSTHPWLGSGREKWDLLLLLDDANSQVYDGLFAEQENTHSVMQITRSVVEKEGIFCSLYTDRGSHFVYTRKAGDPPDKSVTTQCERAFKQLGIRLIVAYSPQARGRGERLWRTVQGRLPQELRRAGISTIEQANKYLKEVFIPELNKLFMVEPKEKGSAFFPVTGETNLDRIFSLHHERQVNNDNTISYKNLTLQIPESPIRQHFVRCKVNVYEHLDGTITIGYGPHTIGKYEKDGTSRTTSTPKQNAFESAWGQNPLGLLGRPQGSAQADLARTTGLRPLPIPGPLLVSADLKGGLSAPTIL